jgi:hypothetical protein
MASSFVVSGLIIYWSGTSNVVKLDLAVLFFLVLYYPSVFGIKISHHLPFWWDVAAVSVFSLIVYYYAIHSRLSPQRVGANVRYAVTDAQQEDAELGLAEHV